MKKFLLSVGLCLGALCMHGQLVEVESVQRVNLPQDLAVSAARLSPDGTQAAVTTLDGTGISLIDLASGSEKKISEDGSVRMLEFSQDGRFVVFRTNTFDSTHRRYSAVKAYDSQSGSTRTIVSPTRNLQGLAMNGSTAVAVENGRAQQVALAGAPAASMPVVSVDYGRLMITENGVTRELSPLGNRANSYLWPSVSPDGTHVAFFAVGCGAYTCRLDGSDLHSLGMLRAVRWLDNNVLVGMDDHDNGVVTTESALVAVSKDGSVSQRITGPEHVAVFPTTADSKIAFTTPAGEMYIINLK